MNLKNSRIFKLSVVAAILVGLLAVFTVDAASQTFLYYVSCGAIVLGVLLSWAFSRS